MSRPPTEAVNITRSFTPIPFAGTTVGYPIVTVTLAASDKALPVSAVVDTGAIATMFAWSAAQALGLVETLKTAPSTLFRGLGGNSIGRLLTIELRVAGKPIAPQTPVYFIEGTTHIAGHTGLLGQYGFLDVVRLVHIGARQGTETVPRFVLQCGY